MYLALIINWDSRIIVGHALSNTLHAGFVVDCVRQAIPLLCPGAILNSRSKSLFSCIAAIS